MSVITNVVCEMKNDMLTYVSVAVALNVSKSYGGITTSK
jgi:hypothetical protein